MPSVQSRLGNPASLDDLLLYRINRLLGVAGSMVIRLCEGRFGITRREWRVLAVLGVPGAAAGLLSSQLAERAQLDRARTSRAVTSLVAKGLLDRQTQPGDRRQARVTLTPAGRALHDALFPLVCDINRELLALLDDREVAALDHALQVLQQRADQLVLRSTALPKADRRRGGRSHRGMG